MWPKRVSQQPGRRYLSSSSAARACSGPQIGQRTGITEGFAILEARAFGAKWQTNAKRLLYGDSTVVLLFLPLRQGDKLRPLVQQLVDEQVASGNRRVVALDWGELQNRACGSHHDTQDHQRMAKMRVDRNKAFGLSW